MSAPKNYRQYLPDDEFDRDEFDRIVVDIPTTPPIPYEVDSIPNGYDPMGRIYLEGRGNRRLASGRVSWWVVVTAWFIAGMTMFVAVLPLFPMTVIEGVFVAVMALLPLSVLGRGTIAKLAASKPKNTPER